jgi:hypothetical protein
MPVPAWGLKLGSLVTTLLVLAGSFGYARTHVKNPNAPLQPPVADKPATTEAFVTPTPIPSLVGTRRGNPSRPTATTAPLRVLPGVQATVLPAITFTHVS